MSIELGIYGLQSEAEAFENVVQALLTATEVHSLSQERHGHAERVAQYAVNVARYMGVGVVERDHLHYGALLHDIGKISIAELWPRSPAALSPSDWERIKQHP